MCSVTQYFSLALLAATLAALVGTGIHGARSASQLKREYPVVWQSLVFRAPWGVPKDERHEAAVQLYLLFGEHVALGDRAIDRAALKYRLAAALTLLFGVASMLLGVSPSIACLGIG